MNSARRRAHRLPLRGDVCGVWQSMHLTAAGDSQRGFWNRNRADFSRPRWLSPAAIKDRSWIYGAASSCTLAMLLVADVTVSVAPAPLSALTLMSYICSARTGGTTYTPGVTARAR